MKASAMGKDKICGVVMFLGAGEVDADASALKDF